MDKVRQEKIQFHDYIKDYQIHCTNLIYESEIKAAMDEYMVISIINIYYLFCYLLYMFYMFYRFLNGQFIYLYILYIIFNSKKYKV